MPPRKVMPTLGDKLMNPIPKVRLTKMLGEGATPAAFSIEGEGLEPKQGTCLFVGKIYKSTGLVATSEPYNWFCTQNIRRVFQLDKGLFFVAGECLWKWEKVI